MAVNQTLIRSRIRQLLEQNKNQENTDQAVEDFADELSLIITDAIRSATVTALPGTIVTVGSPTTQSNPSPINFQIN